MAANATLLLVSCVPCVMAVFFSVVAGRAHDKADCPRSVTGTDRADDDTELGHIISPIHSTSIEKHADECHKVVGGAEYADQKFKIFDINGLEDKYLNSIINRSCHFTSIPNCDLEESYKNWKAQSDFDFGFIPMGEFRFSESEEIHEMLHYCPIKAHAMVKQYKKKTNFLGARLKVDSQLNLGAWKFHLSDYWDKQLIDLLYFGFPLNFNRNSPLKWEGSNHSSAINFPRDIEAYLSEELAHNAIVGPFTEHPCPGGHISPFLTREKANSENRRVTVDLSWPLGYSVNGGIDKNSPTIDHITEQLKKRAKDAIYIRLTYPEHSGTSRWILWTMIS